jgi:hypothetical protein
LEIQGLESVAKIAGGIILGFFIKYVWEKFNKSYVTDSDFMKAFEKHVVECEARKLISEAKVEAVRIVDNTKATTERSDMSDEIRTIKRVVLKLASKAGIPVEQYEDLAK